MASTAAQEDNRRRVLVVDDHLGICAMMARALDAEGYAVQTAYNGWAALELLRGWEPDLILLDLMMPVMDGWAFRRAQLADERLAPIPVIVLSAGLVDLPPSQAAAATIPKPWRMDVLLKTMRQLMSPTTTV